jgi:hypothetical protein
VVIPSGVEHHRARSLAVAAEYRFPIINWPQSIVTREYSVASRIVSAARQIAAGAISGISGESSVKRLQQSPYFL